MFLINNNTIEKHGIRMAMLVLVLVRSVNYEISKIRKKSKAKYLEIKKNAKRAVYQAEYKTERK